jgi:hypothetical protein
VAAAEVHALLLPSLSVEDFQCMTVLITTVLMQFQMNLGRPLLLELNIANRQ